MIQKTQRRGGEVPHDPEDVEEEKNDIEYIEHQPVTNIMVEKDPEEKRKEEESGEG